MMSIDDALDLVVYAFQHGKPGDILGQKAPAATIASIAEALKRIFTSGAAIKTIGTRHGEKLYETLMTREEMARAVDLGDCFRIPSDTRDLNYNLYFTEGQENVSKHQDYNSHNTRRLELKELIEMLLKLDVVQKELEGQKK